MCVCVYTWVWQKFHLSDKVWSYYPILFHLKKNVWESLNYMSYNHDLHDCFNSVFNYSIYAHDFQIYISSADVSIKS